MMILGCEVFARDALYDFAASGLPARLRALGTELTLGKGFFRPPPIDSMHLHRKIGGTYLLCARLRARVNVRAIAEPFLTRCLASQA